MKKAIYIIAAVVGVFFTIGIILSLTKPQLPDITNKNKFVYGPYSCNGKSLTIEQTFNANNLEGAYSLADITVTYGENLVFKNIFSFQNDIEKKTNKTFKFDEYENYLGSTQKSVVLPSQEELISRELSPDEKGRVILGSVSAAMQEDLERFAECFNQNKKLIYDQETDQSSKHPPYYLYYYKAYLLKI